MLLTNQLTRCPIQLRIVRKHTLEFETLRDSIRQNGVLTPLLVNTKHEVVDGAHRFEAALDCHLEEVPCTVREMSIEEIERFQVILNTHAATEDLARRLIEISQSGCTVNELAHRVNQHPDWIRRILRLKTDRELPVTVAFELSKLPKSTQDTLLLSYDNVSNEAFIDVVRAEIRGFRRRGHSARSLDNINRDLRFRHLKEVKREYLYPTVAASVISSENAKSALDGWHAALGWVLRNDLASVAKNP